jgi:hypothetical protein
VIDETAIVEVGPRRRVCAFTRVMAGASIGVGCNIGSHCFVGTRAVVGTAVTEEERITGVLEAPTSSQLGRSC